MSKTKDEKDQKRGRKARRDYQAPDFLASLAFERRSLSCGGNLTNSPVFPQNCGLQS